MKNAVKLLFVAIVMFAFAACGGAAKTEEAAQDTTKVEEVAPAAPDTTVKADSAQ